MVAGKLKTLSSIARALILLGSMGVSLSSFATGIQGCPRDATRNGNKVVIGSVTDLVGSVNSRFSRALLASFEMRFERADAELGEEATVLYCDTREVRGSDSYNQSVVGLLNDEQVLLEVGVKPNGSDIMVTYVVIPIRHYQYFGTGDSSVRGYHQAIYDQSRISSGLEALFNDNADLRLMAALALALRHEQLAKSESDSDKRRTLIHRSRAFYCDALGSAEKARPTPDFLGLPASEWEALWKFAQSGTKRLFLDATGDADYVGGLDVVASERGGSSAVTATCLYTSVAAIDEESR